MNSWILIFLISKPNQCAWQTICQSIIFCVSFLYWNFSGFYSQFCTQVVMCITTITITVTINITYLRTCACQGVMNVSFSENLPNILNELSIPSYSRVWNRFRKVLNKALSSETGLKIKMWSHHILFTEERIHNITFCLRRRTFTTCRLLTS